MHIGYIYITTNLINNRVYIGKKNKSIFDQTYYGSGLLLNRAIQKYGKENFKVELIQWASSIDELNMLEVQFIAEYKKKTNTYNIAEGGTGGNTTKNHPDRLSIIDKRASGLKLWHQNMTAEEKNIHNLKISNAKKGKPNGCLGKTRSEETKKKISDAQKGKPKSEKQRIAHAIASAANIGKPNSSCFKRVIVNGVEYDSIKSACVALNITSNSLFYYRMKKQLITVEYINDK